MGEKLECFFCCFFFFWGGGGEGGASPLDRTLEVEGVGMRLYCMPHVVQTINTHKQEEKEPTLFPEENTPQPIYPLALLHYDTSHRGRHNSRCKNMCPRTGQ